ncbi:MAG: UbiA family prenyltransferase [Candidatus Anstonellales archaeon]
MMSTLKAWVALFRAEHALLICIAIAFSQYITGAAPNIIHYIAPILAQFSAFALNDYLDAEADKLNKRKDRPIVSGLVTKEQALYAGVGALALSLVAALFLPLIALSIVLLFNALSLLYNLRLKDYPLVGEFYIASSMAIPFIYGASFAQVTVPIIVITITVFFFGIGREIIKKVEDMAGDKKARGASTLPILIGAKGAVKVAIAFLSVSFALFAVAFFLFFIPNPVSLLFFAFMAILLFYSVYSAIANDYKKARMVSLASMFFALIALFFGAFP